jgi:O-antigen ligase
VIQNILTSLFNSHLFDFHEGWMYMLGELPGNAAQGWLCELRAIERRNRICSVPL